MKRRETILVVVLIVLIACYRAFQPSTARPVITDRYEYFNSIADSLKLNGDVGTDRSFEEFKWDSVLLPRAKMPRRLRRFLTSEDLQLTGSPTVRCQTNGGEVSLSWDLHVYAADRPTGAITRLLQRLQQLGFRHSTRLASLHLVGERNEWAQQYSSERHLKMLSKSMGYVFEELLIRKVGDGPNDTSSKFRICWNLSRKIEVSAPTLQTMLGMSVFVAPSIEDDPVYPIFQDRPTYSCTMPLDKKAHGHWSVEIEG